MGYHLPPAKSPAGSHTTSDICEWSERLPHDRLCCIVPNFQHPDSHFSANIPQNIAQDSQILLRPSIFQNSI